MTCPQENLISRFHDGELSPAERKTVEAHLAGCADCRAAVRAYRRVSAVFDQAPAVRLSDAARDRLLLEVRSAARWRMVSRITRPFALAAAIILAVGLPLLALSPTPQPPQDAVMTSSVAGPLPTAWEATLLTRETDPVADSSQVQLAEFFASDLSLARR